MKTAVSIPDDLFTAADELAAARGLSRSALYAEALRRLLAERSDAEITRRLDELYGDEGEPSTLDPALAALQLASLEREDW